MEVKSLRPARDQTLRTRNMSPLLAPVRDRMAAAMQDARSPSTNPAPCTTGIPGWAMGDFTDEILSRMLQRA